MNDMSVFTNRGPLTGARGALPNSPGAAGWKHAVLNHSCKVGWLNFGLHVMSGRFKLFPFHWKLTPEALALSTTNSGKPEVALSMTSTSHPPSTAFTGALQSEPNCLPFPNGRLYVT